MTSSERLPAATGALKPTLASASRLVRKCRHTTRRAVESATKVLHTVDPAFVGQTETIQDRSQLGWDRSPFVSPYLTPGPIQELQMC